ncbi:MAG: AbrB/MazE/SpoVT family DNA-binding domain-containing protein [Candidatus Doudnabacteria bacterium]|nr:AbrB/MazE/SpoVT family DNA-binding domain-containing protein [Candidatus Doudnabacteria bacterium]
MDSKIHQQDKMYGTTTIGARGQVVIPAQARKDLKLKPGDQFIVMGKFGKVVALVKTDQLSELIETIMSNISNPSWKKGIKKHMQGVLGSQFIK